MDHLFEDWPRDQVFHLRRDLTLQIGKLFDDAISNGSSDAYLLADLRYGLPLAATCLATPADYALPEGLPAEGVALLLSHEGDDTGVLTIEGTECAAILHKTPATPSLASTEEIPTEQNLEDALAHLTVTRLDVYVPFPDRPRTLLLTFSTPIEPVAAEMTLLFEAIAESLRWRWE